MTVSRRRFIKIAGAAGAVLVAGGAAGYYALTSQGAPPATEKVTTPTTRVTLPGNSVRSLFFDLPQNIGLRMQYQECGDWCWIAVATSIYLFYNPASTATQCEIRTKVGHTIGGYTGNACPTPEAIATVPGLAKILADPYSATALFALSKNPSLGCDKTSGCDKPGGVRDALKVNGNLKNELTSLPPLAQIASEMSERRPIAVDIKWKSGGQHCVAIAGVLNDMLLICNPISGESVIQYESFPSAYGGGASVVAVCLTQKG